MLETSTYHVHEGMHSEMMVLYFLEGKNYGLSANKQSDELHTAVSVAFSVPSSVQSKNWWRTALIYSFSADSTEEGGVKG